MYVQVPVRYFSGTVWHFDAEIAEIFTSPSCGKIQKWRETQGNSLAVFTDTFEIPPKSKLWQDSELKTDTRQLSLHFSKVNQVGGFSKKPNSF